MLAMVQETIASPALIQTFSSARSVHRILPRAATTIYSESSIRLEIPDIVDG